MRRRVNIPDPIGDFSVAEFDELFFALQINGVIDFATDAFYGAAFCAHETVGTQIIHVVEVKHVMVDDAWLRKGGGGREEGLKEERKERRKEEREEEREGRREEGRKEGNEERRKEERKVGRMEGRKEGRKERRKEGRESEEKT